MLPLEGAIHLPGHAAVAEVAGGGGAQLRDVLGFGEVHFEEAADAGGEGQQVERRGFGLGRGPGGDADGGLVGGFDGGLVVGQDAGIGKDVDVRAEVAGGRGVVAVEGGERLDDLDAAAVAVHVAKAADVHEDVKAECGSGVEGAQGFVVFAAMAEAKLDNFTHLSGSEAGDEVANLAVGVVADRVKQGGGQLDFKGFGALDEVDEGGFRDGQASQEFLGGGGELDAGFELVGVGVGVFDEGGRGADLAVAEVGGLGGEVIFAGDGGDFVD